jgi:hypothetical protein
MESTAYSTGVGHAPTGSQANEVEAGPNRLASAAQSRARARRRQDRATRKHCRGGGRGKHRKNCRHRMQTRWASQRCYNPDLVRRVRTRRSASTWTCALDDEGPSPTPAGVLAGPSCCGPSLRRIAFDLSQTKGSLRRAVRWILTMGFGPERSHGTVPCLFRRA